MHLKARRVFAGSNLSIIEWSGNAGAFHFSTGTETIKRTDYASSSMVVRGSFKMTEAPGDLARFPLIKPGDMCNLIMPDFEPGSYKWCAMENGSVEFCCGTTGPNGGADFGRFISLPRKDGGYRVPKGSVLIVATGRVFWNGLWLDAPRILHAKTLDVEAQLEGRGMWLVRP